jgi:hypothetical protein
MKPASQSKTFNIGNLREFYYSACDAGIYHTRHNCPVGREIDARYLRKTYFPNSHMQKCEACQSLEQDEERRVLGVPDLARQNA